MNYFYSGKIEGTMEQLVEKITIRLNGSFNGSGSYGMQGNNRMGGNSTYGMMGGNGYNRDTPPGERLTIDEARDKVLVYLSDRRMKNLELNEIMEF